MLGRKKFYNKKTYDPESEKKSEGSFVSLTAKLVSKRVERDSFTLNVQVWP